MNTRVDDKNDLVVYIPTYDSNIFVIKYFQYFFNKYWDSNIKVKILGFNPPNFELKSNFEFISLGKVQINGAKGWTNYLIPFFEQLESKYFIFGIDDFMIVRPVNQKIFNAAWNIMNNGIGRIDLQPLYYARPKNFFSLYREYEDIKFIKMKDKARKKVNLYRNAGAFSIWNRNWFLKNMHKNWSPWDWEIKGSKFSENDGYEVIGTMDQFAILKSELLSEQWPNKINTLAIRESDVEEMKKLIQPSDRISDFETIGRDIFGYSKYAGPDWEEKLYGP
jgi:hypothetical protein